MIMLNAIQSDMMVRRLFHAAMASGRSGTRASTGNAARPEGSRRSPPRGARGEAAGRSGFRSTERRRASPPRWVCRPRAPRERRGRPEPGHVRRHLVNTRRGDRHADGRILARRAVVFAETLVRGHDSRARGRRSRSSRASAARNGVARPRGGTVTFEHVSFLGRRRDSAHQRRRARANRPRVRWRVVGLWPSPPTTPPAHARRPFQLSLVS